MLRLGTVCLILLQALSACPRDVPRTVAGRDEQAMDEIVAQLEEIRTRPNLGCVGLCGLKERVCDLSEQACALASRDANRADFQTSCVTSREDCARCNEACATCRR